MLRNLFFILIVGFGLHNAYSQTPPPDDDEDIPIDGGIGILAIAGIAYATKRVYELRK